MLCDNLVFTSNIDGKFICEINRSDGTPQDLTGCDITLKIAFLSENDSIVVLTNPLINKNICIFDLKPEDTNILSCGEHDIQLIIIDTTGRKIVTKRITISIQNIIE